MKTPTPITALTLALTVALALTGCSEVESSLGGNVPASIKATLPPSLVAGQPLLITLETSLEGELTIVQKSGPTTPATLKNKTVTLTPPKEGEYVYTVSLKTSGGTTSSEVKFSVSGAVTPPPEIAVSLSSSALLGTTIPLRPSGLPAGASCSWTVVTRPAGSSATPDLGCNSKFKPDQKGDYSLRFVASQSVGAETATKEIARINLGLYVYNDAPTAKIVALGNSSSVLSTLSFDSSGSSDPEGTALSREWTLIERPNGSSAKLELDGAVASFRGDRSGRYKIGLTVSDGNQNSEEVSLSLNLTNLPPLSNPGGNQNVAVGATVALSGASSLDPEGGPLRLTWEMISRPIGSGAGLSNTRGETSEFIADKAGVYTLELRASDGESETSRTVTVTATAPIVAKQ